MNAYILRIYWRLSWFEFAELLPFYNLAHPRFMEGGLMVCDVPWEFCVCLYFEGVKFFAVHIMVVEDLVLSESLVSVAALMQIRLASGL